MTNEEKMQHAVNVLAGRCGDLLAEVVNLRVELEEQRRRADAAEAKLPKEEPPTQGT